MELEIRRDVEDFIGVISEFEKRRNRELRKKIAFLRKYLGVWREGNDPNQMRSINPNPFYITKEKFDV